jgi:hypothetical protein
MLKKTDYQTSCPHDCHPAPGILRVRELIRARFAQDDMIGAPRLVHEVNAASVAAEMDTTPPTPAPPRETLSYGGPHRPLPSAETSAPYCETASAGFPDSSRTDA